MRKSKVSSTAERFILNFSGAKVKELRTKKRWTQVEMAKKLYDTGKFNGQTRQRIHQIESGQHASAQTICALCEIFEVRPAFFFE